MHVDLTTKLTSTIRIPNITRKTFRHEKRATSVMSSSSFKSGHVVIDIARMTLKPQLSALYMSNCCIYLHQVVEILS